MVQKSFKDKTHFEERLSVAIIIIIIIKFTQHNFYLYNDSTLQMFLIAATLQ
jgi:hypothetical protein